MDGVDGARGEVEELGPKARLVLPPMAWQPGKCAPYRSSITPQQTVEGTGFQSHVAFLQPASNLTMADARALLRQQRAARQQAQKPQKQSAAPAAAPVSKKRKAIDENAEERKRTRTEAEVGVPAGFFDGGASNEAHEDETHVEHTHTTQESTPAPETRPPEPAITNGPPLDPSAEAELDAFMSELSRAKPAPPPPSYSGAVIESAPMTAADIAAQAREELSAQRAKKDEEMEGEKEDAARALEDEFEEMENLEEKVKKLREKREALRLKHVQPVEAEAVPDAPLAEEDGESESEDEEWDDWRFRPA